MDKHKATTLAVLNCKGGQSKTTTVISLGHALATRKLKVLIVDLDPQASASLALGFKRHDLSPSISEVLIEEYPINNVIRKTTIKDLDILTGSISLSSFDVTFANTDGRESMLKEALSEVSNQYDVIIIDCPPTLGLLVLNAIVAADNLIVPVVPQYLALEGLITLTEALERMKTGIGSSVKIMGILLTQVDRRSRAAKEISCLINEQYKDMVFKTEVAINCKLSEAPSFGKTIFQYDWSAPSAAAYTCVAEEVVSKLKLKGVQK